MAEEKIVRVPAAYDATPRDWESEIIDAPNDYPRRAVWIPLKRDTGNWYLAQQEGIHNAANQALLEYMEREIARQLDAAVDKVRAE